MNPFTRDNVQPFLNINIPPQCVTIDKPTLIHHNQQFALGLTCLCCSTDLTKVSCHVSTITYFYKEVSCSKILWAPICSSLVLLNPWWSLIFILALMFLPFCRMSYSWNHTVCGLSDYLLSLGDMYSLLYIVVALYFIYFQGWMKFHWLDIPLFTSIYLLKDILLLPSFDSYEWNCYEYLCARLCVTCFWLIWVNTKECNVGSYCKSLFSFVRNYQTSSSGYTICIPPGN